MTPGGPAPFSRPTLSVCPALQQHLTPGEEDTLLTERISDHFTKRSKHLNIHFEFAIKNLSKHSNFRPTFVKLSSMCVFVPVGLAHVTAENKCQSLYFNTSCLFCRALLFNTEHTKGAK